MMLLDATKTEIKDEFWDPILTINAEKAIFHQWDQLVSSKCIDNFRIVSGEIDGVHEGWFFADSDAYKWLDAAARIYARRPLEVLKMKMGTLVDLLWRAQDRDGYLYTYNQINFPDSRWQNMMIEHELYCHGHLIEAGIAHKQATGENKGLLIAERAADMLVREFFYAGSIKTSGHEEVELALLRLFRCSGRISYRDLASVFLERRGKNLLFFMPVILQSNRSAKRRRVVQKRRGLFREAHPDYSKFKLPSPNIAKEPKNSRIRWVISALSGKYFQMHAPIRKQLKPVGHAVRFAYLETAIAMLYRITGDQTLLASMEAAWDRMVSRRMYVTGGLGAVPGLEGFGRDYELDPEYAYGETCAALGSLLWNWEMAQATHEARFSELFEWQLYNAAAVGMGICGVKYLYNNPLASRGGISRKSWFSVPCCPSNLSRFWASLPDFIASSSRDEIWIHQFLGSRIPVRAGGYICINSRLPWDGRVSFRFDMSEPTGFTLHLRNPIWADRTSIDINEEKATQKCAKQRRFNTGKVCASGYDPRLSSYLQVHRDVWKPGDVVDITFDMPIKIRRATPNVSGHTGKFAVTRGPLVYCLESVDNPKLDIFNISVDPTSLRACYSPSLLGGSSLISGMSASGDICTFIPYYLWANREDSSMTVWVNE